MKKVHLLLFAAILFFASCGNESENKVTHLPYQLEEDGRWGLIDWEGNPLIEEEFKHQPSVVIDGMFCVKNSDDKYEIYTAEKKPKQVGEEYLYVGQFSNGLAPVVEKDSRINYINKEGKSVFELTKYKDDPIVKAWPFYNGIALVETASGKGGAINIKGEFVVPPIYKGIFYAGDNILWILDEKDKVGYIDHKGKILIEPKYTYGYHFDKKGYATVGLDNKSILIDKTGKEIIKLKEGMGLIGECIDEDLIPYCLDNESYGYLNLKGEKEIKLSSNINNPSSFSNGYAVFNNSDGDYGTIDTKGEIVIRAKYDELRMLEGFDFLLFEEEDEWGLLSYTGDVIKRASYKEIIPFVKGNQYTYAKDGKEWILIDQKGEDTKKVDVETIDYGYNNGYSDYVISDYFDVDAEAYSLLSILNENGTIDKATFEMTPGEFANTYNMEYKPSDLQGKKEIQTAISSLKYADRWIGIIYNNEVIKADYKREWVSNRWGGYYDDVISGYSYNNNQQADKIIYYIKLKRKLAEKRNDAYTAMCKWLENHGYIFSSSEEKNSGQSKYYKKGGISLGIHLENEQINVVTGVDAETKYAANKAAGEKFLAENAKKPGVKVTESGLQYKIIKEGKGAIPNNTDLVKVHYKCISIDGTEFDSSYKRNAPSSFRPNHLIAGWTEALTMMPVGSKWELYIPQELAYGAREAGQIKPFSALVYEVELLEIEKRI